MHDDICVAADGRGEVSVEGYVQGVVAKEGLVLQDAGAEVESHLKGVRSEGRVSARMVKGPCTELEGSVSARQSSGSRWSFTCCSVWAAQGQGRHCRN